MSLPRSKIKPVKTCDSFKGASLQSKLFSRRAATTRDPSRFTSSASPPKIATPSTYTAAAHLFESKAGAGVRSTTISVSAMPVVRTTASTHF